MTGAHVRRGELPPVVWFLLLLAGQGAALALSWSGKAVTYQHYDLSRLVSPSHAWATVVLVIQAAAVVRWLLGRWPVIRTWGGAQLTAAGVLVAGAVFVITSAAPSRAPLEWAAELAFATLVQLVALGTVAALALALRADEGWVTRWLGENGDPHPGRFFDPVAVAAAVWVVALCAMLAAVAYERAPHLPDEIIYLIHARYFAAGMLQLPAPPVAAAFDVDLLYYDETRVFSPVPPGWPALLAVGVRLGVPWLVNPVLSGVGVLLFHALMRRIESPRTARLATLLLATSPWFLFLGMSLMTHSATLVFAIGAALGVAEAKRRSIAWPAALAGIATAMVGLIRPLEGLAVALVAGLWSLGARHPRWRLLPSAVLTVVTVAASAIVRPYNAWLTGAANRFPIMMYVDKYYAPGANDLGFGANRGMGWGGLDPFPGHGVRDVVVNTLLNGYALNRELFGWITGSLLFILVCLASRRLRRTDWAMAGVIVLVVGLHALYWFSGGPDFGARYWYLVIVPCIALAARAPEAAFTSAGAARATAAVLALSAAALVTFLPWRAVEKYHRYRGMGGQMRVFAEQNALGEALVLVRGRRQPDYHLAALENPLDLRAPRTVYAWDRTPEVRRAAVAAYPDRPVYVIDGPTITGDGFRIVAGPLPPGSLAPDIPSSIDIPIVVAGDAEAGAQRRGP